MPVRFRILPELALIHIRYTDTAGVDETLRAMKSCVAHPDFDPGFRHLVDFAGLTDFRFDPVDLIQVAARVPDIIDDRARGTYLIYYAPTPGAQRLVQAVMKSWQGVSASVLAMADDPHKVADCLGLPPGAIDCLGLAEPGVA